MTRTYLVETYGCQMNVHDSERIAGLLDEAGYLPVAEGSQADIVVGNDDCIVVLECVVHDPVVGIAKVTRRVEYPLVNSFVHCLGSARQINRRFFGV